MAGFLTFQNAVPNAKYFPNCVKSWWRYPTKMRINWMRPSKIQTWPTTTKSRAWSVGVCDTSTEDFLFIYLGFYVAFNTVQVISRRVAGRAEETSTYSLSGFCTVNCRPTASNYQLSHLRPCREPNPGLRGGRRECYHSVTVAPRQHERVWPWYNILYHDRSSRIPYVMWLHDHIRMCKMIKCKTYWPVSGWQNLV